MKIARIYLRVSTNEQDLERQRSLKDKAEKEGFYIAKVYAEKISATLANRPQLDALIEDLQKNDVIIAESIDRITRLQLKDAQALFRRIKEKGAIVSVPEIIDLSYVSNATENLMAKAVLEGMQDVLLNIALAQARYDYEIRRKRQAQGIQLAKTNGKYKGRKINKELHEKIIMLREKGQSIRKTASILNCSTATVTNVMKKFKNNYVNNHK